MACQTPEWILRLTPHDALWQVRFCDHYCAETFQCFHDGGIRVSRRKSAPDVAQRRVEALHIELVLERYRHTMERTDKLAFIFMELVKPSSIIDRIIERDFRKTVGL